MSVEVIHANYAEFMLCCLETFYQKQLLRKQPLLRRTVQLKNVDFFLKLSTRRNMYVLSYEQSVANLTTFTADYIMFLILHYTLIYFFQEEGY